MKLKDGMFFTAQTENSIPFGGTIAVKEDRVYLLSDYSEFNATNLPSANRQGFAYAYRISGGTFDINENHDNINDLNDYVDGYLPSDVRGFQIVPKRQALRAIILYRKNNIEISSYDTHFNGREFVFGCGAVEASPKDVQIILKLLSRYTKPEWVELVNIIDNINSGDSSALESLKDDEENMKKLLKMPAYLEYLKKKTYALNKSTVGS